jgi:universal stress protein E
MSVRKLFVVYDPTIEDQLALKRAQVIASNDGSEVHLYACIHDDTSPAAGAAAGTAAQREILERALEPLKAKGIAVSSEVEWEKDWYSAVINAARRHGADEVLKSSQRHSKGQRLLKKTSDWALIRECHCQVLLVKSAATEEPRKVLAALNLRGETSEYGELNRNILDFCKRYTGGDRGAEVHFLNSHKDLASRPDRGTLLRLCGVDGDHVHIRMGDPDDLIVELAKELGANLVILGNSARSGLSALVKSNTAEKVLDKLDCDLLALT